MICANFNKMVPYLHFCVRNAAHKHLPGRAAAPLSDSMVFCVVVLLLLSFTASWQVRSRHRNVTGGAASCAYALFVRVAADPGWLAWLAD